ncbi:MAG: YicC family protein [Bacteroidales bacterium]|nr:YicC family protein [Bacteroidales bacterium]
MKSMTGYAKQQCLIDGTTYTIEIKTLNSKQLDVQVKVPSACRQYELTIRSMLNRLERGKVDLLLSEERGEGRAASLNAALVRSRHEELRQLCDDMGLPTQGLLSDVLAQADVWTGGTDEVMEEEAWHQLEAAIAQTIDDCDRFRQQEGDVLQKDICKHLDLIEQKSLEIPPFENERIDKAKERIRKYLDDFGVTNVDENRFEQELIYYLEKLDITEEKVRLAKHINYFRETVATETVCGKKLGFIAQEMGREINTTGSKANHAQIQRIVVEMKDELEKIKEQLGNIL